MRRTLSVLSVPQFLQLLDDAQRMWVDQRLAAAWLNETQIFWLSQQQQFMVVSFTRADQFRPNASQVQEVLAGARGAGACSCLVLQTAEVGSRALLAAAALCMPRVTCAARQA